MNEISITNYPQSPTPAQIADKAARRAAADEIAAAKSLSRSNSEKNRARVAVEFPGANPSDELIARCFFASLLQCGTDDTEETALAHANEHAAKITNYRATACKILQGRAMEFTIAPTA